MGAVTVRVGDGTGEFRLPEAQTIEEVPRRVRPRVGSGAAGGGGFKPTCIDCIDGLSEGVEGMSTAGGAEDVAKAAEQMTLDGKEQVQEVHEDSHLC